MGSAEPEFQPGPWSSWCGVGSQALGEEDNQFAFEGDCPGGVSLETERHLRSDS